MFPLYLLGYAWMLEEGMDFAETVSAPFKKKDRFATKEEWRQSALFYLRWIFEGYYERDPRNDVNQPFTPGTEAKEAIIRLIKNDTTPEAKTELKRLKAAINRFEHSPISISPIVFPMRGRLPLSSLLTNNKPVRFDLMGSGAKSGERWSWVNNRAGILVWDPLHTGKIRSGHQLFGNVTWCMIWQHGYQPLERLDDNHNGSLQGKELEGLAVWCDKNENGVSDKGEVIPLRKLGIVRIAVHGQQRQGIYWNPQGIVRRDGSTLPTYDWIAQEMPANTPK